jgi:hypothetical protein
MGLELRKARPDLIHYHAPNLWGALMIVLFASGTPLVITHHVDIERRGLLKKITMPLYQLLLGRTSCVLVNSVKNATLSTDLRGNIARAAAVPHGIDENQYVLDEAAENEVVQRRQQLFGSDIVIGLSGGWSGIRACRNCCARLRGFPTHHCS